MIRLRSLSLSNDDGGVAIDKVDEWSSLSMVVVTVWDPERRRRWRRVFGSASSLPDFCRVALENGGGGVVNGNHVKSNEIPYFYQ